jgi:hypothetical protein
VVLGIDRRDKKQYRQNKECLAVLHHKSIGTVQAGNKGTVCIFTDGAVQQQQNGGKNHHYRGNAQQHAFCHNNPDIPAQQEPHKAQGKKAGNGGQRAAKQ